MSILNGGPVLSFSVIDLDPLNIGGFLVPQGASVSLSQQKIITKTQVGSSEGTVKEFSGFSDWNVTIDFEYPYPMKALAIAQLKLLANIWKVEIALPVINSRLQAVGITHVVIEQLDLPDPDVDHELKAQIKCCSDKQIDLADPDSLGVMSEKSGVLDKIGGVLNQL